MAFWGYEFYLLVLKVVNNSIITILELPFNIDHIFQCRTNIKKFSTLYQGPKIWNSLPVTTVSSPSISIFNKKSEKLSH